MRRSSTNFAGDKCDSLLAPMRETNSCYTKNFPAPRARHSFSCCETESFSQENLGRFPLSLRRNRVALGSWPSNSRCTSSLLLIISFKINSALLDTRKIKKDLAVCSLVINFPRFSCVGLLMSFRLYFDGDGQSWISDAIPSSLTLIVIVNRRRFCFEIWNSLFWYFSLNLDNNNSSRVLILEAFLVFELT